MAAKGLQAWQLADFSGGMVDYVGSNLLQDNQSPTCYNMIANRMGHLAKRTGQARLNSAALAGAPIQGLFGFFNASTLARAVVAACGGSVYKWTGSAFSSILSGLDASAQVSMEMCINYMAGCNGVQAPWKWDGTTESALANAPADAWLFKLYKTQLFAVTRSNPSRMVWSNPADPETWQGVNYWDVDPGDGDVITALVPYLGDLAVFKAHSTYDFQGVGVSDGQLNLIDPAVGCVGPLAVTFYGQYLYFVGWDGIYQYNGGKTTNLTRTTIPGLWSTVNQAALSTAVATTWKDRIWFGVPTGSATTPNLTIVFDPKTNAFWPMPGIDPTAFLVYNDGSQESLYAGDAAGFVNQQDTGVTDFGAAISASWTSKAFDAGQPERKKKFWRLHVVDSYTAGADRMTVDSALDFGTAVAPVYEDGDNFERRHFFQPGSWGRYLQLRLSDATINSVNDVTGALVEYEVARKAG